MCIFLRFHATSVTLLFFFFLCEISFENVGGHDRLSSPGPFFFDISCECQIPQVLIPYYVSKKRQLSLSDYEVCVFFDSVFLMF